MPKTGEINEIAGIVEVTVSSQLAIIAKTVDNTEIAEIAEIADFVGIAKSNADC